MNNLNEIINIMYETSMSIGTSLDLNQMLRSFFSTILRKLNCSGGIVFKLVLEKEKSYFKLIYSFPMNVYFEDIHPFLSIRTPVCFDEYELNDFNKKLPLTVHKDSFFHIMELEDFGIMVLQRKKNFLNNELLNSLIPISKKLSHAINACELHKEVDLSRQKYRDLLIIKDSLLFEKQKVADELERAKLVAEMANKTKDVFLSNMSHELRTPLNVIINTSRLLFETDINSEQEELLSRVVKSSMDVKKLVEDILDIDRLENGLLSLTIGKHSLKDIVNYLKNAMGPIADKKNIIFEVNIDSDFDDAIWCDRLRLEQILVNLLQNAINHTSEGSVLLSIKQLNKVLDKAFFEFIIKDTGVGIPEDIVDSIFERYNQGEISYNKKHSGLGIGLAIVKKLVDLMDGNISVESKEGKGSAFKVVLPFRELKHVLLKNSRVGMKKLMGKIRVLVAEDDEGNMYILKRLIKKIVPNVTIVEARNGEIAVQMFRDASPDIVFMDAQMPLMDGFEATKSIRRESSGVVIVGVTAHSLREERDKFIRFGADYCYSKPINSSDIENVFMNSRINKLCFAK